MNPYYPQNYFEKEIRCGFEIGHLMKTCWAAQLKILQAIKDICRRNNLVYYAAFGTLLGAVRHKGYIPWDDDLDIALKREDYMTFLNVAQKELPREYKLLNVYCEEEWYGSFSRITNSSVINVSKEFLEQNYGCPFIVGVDVYPYDYLPRNQHERELQKSLLDLTRNTILLYEQCMKQQTEGNKNNFLSAAQKLVQYTGITIDEKLNIENQLYQIYDRICMMYDEDEADELVSFQAHLSHCAGEWSKECFSQTIEMEFETGTIAVPVKYDEVLMKTFGDYRRLIYRGGHDYPFYKEQLEMLLQRNMWSLEDGLAAGEFQWEKEGHKYNLPETVWERIPEEWQKLLYNKNKTKKRVLLYVTTLSGLLCEEEKYLYKIERVLEMMETNSQILCWWFPENVDDCLYRMQKPDLFKKYENICQKYRKSNWGIWDCSGNIQRAIQYSDAMYGDYGQVFEIYQKSKKPIMIQNVDI